MRGGGGGGPVTGATFLRHSFRAKQPVADLVKLCQTRRKVISQGSWKGRWKEGWMEEMKEGRKDEGLEREIVRIEKWKQNRRKEEREKESSPEDTAPSTWS